MSLTDEHIKESLSYCYIQALSAAAGLNFSARPYDYDYGLDGKLSKIRRVFGGDGRSRKTYQFSAHLAFQLKATTTWQVRQSDQRITYPLDVDAYNKIVSSNRDMEENPVPGKVPTILLVLCLPKSSRKADWFSHDSHSLTLMKALYWKYLVGPDSINSRSVTVEFNEDEIVTAQVLSDLMDKLESGSFLR